MMGDHFERIWKEIIMAERRFYPVIYLREVEKFRENLVKKPVVQFHAIAN